MKRTFIYAIVAAMGVTGVAETAPQASAAENKGPTSLEQVRAKVRAEAMTSLAAGEVTTVRHHRWRGRRHYRRDGYYGRPRHYRRRYYYRDPYYYGGPRYHRRHHYRRSGVYFGIGF